MSDCVQFSEYERSMVKHYYVVIDITPEFTIYSLHSGVPACFVVILIEPEIMFLSR